MHAKQDCLWYSQSPVSPFVSSFRGTPVNHSGFFVEDPAHCLLTQCPKFGDFDYGVMSLVCEIRRNRIDQPYLGRSWQFSSEIRHKILPETMLARSRKYTSVNSFEASLPIVSNHFSSGWYSQRLYLLGWRSRSVNLRPFPKTARRDYERLRSCRTGTPPDGKPNGRRYQRSKNYGIPRSSRH